MGENDMFTGINLKSADLTRNFLARDVPRNLRNVLAQLAGFRASFERAREIRPDGFTIDSLGNVRDYASGFAVSTHSYETIDELIAENQNVLACGELSSLHFGFWTDRETGRSYIDATEIVDNLFTALDTAQRYAQLAVWDFANKREVRVAEKPGI